MANEQTTDLVATLRDPNWTHPPRWLLLKAADEIERLRCRGNDPYCPCQDDFACHYVDLPGSPAMKPKERAKDAQPDHND